MKKLGLALAGAAMLSSQAQGQSSGTVSAKNPAGLMAVLERAGYSPKLDKDSFGDPEIALKIAGYEATMLFYGCDESTNKGCDSVQLRAGFDREKPWTAAEAIEVTKKYRFAAVWLDDEGDPYVQWDIMTGDGIPSAVFLSAIEGFGSTLEDTAEIVFADE